MTINITIESLNTYKNWYVCGNNGCPNMIKGRYAVCLKCWIEHLASHGTEFSLLKQYNYDLQSIKTVGKLSV